MTIGSTSNIGPTPFQQVQRAVPSDGLRITRRFAETAGATRPGDRAHARQAPPTIGQHIDKVLSTAEKTLFALLFSKSEAPAEPLSVAPAPVAKPRSRPQGSGLGRKIDIRG